MSKKESGRYKRKKEKEQARKKEYLFRGSSLLLVLIILLYWYGNVYVPNSINTPSWITVISRINLESPNSDVLLELPRDILKDAVAAASEWNEIYECGRDIVIQPLQDGEVIDLGDGWKLTTTETAEPGVINLFPDMPPDEIANSTYHALTHACKDEADMFEESPVKYFDGEIIGFEGLTVIIRLKNGEVTKFTKMEEGAAEAIASVMPGYSITVKEYYNVWRLTLKYFGKDKDHSLKELQDLVAANDVRGFVAIILNKDVSLVSDLDIEDVMFMYDEIYSFE